jgi:hypothetical protein
VLGQKVRAPSQAGAIPPVTIAIKTRHRPVSFDLLIGSGKQHVWYRDAHASAVLRSITSSKFSGPLYRRFLAVQNSADAPHLRNGSFMFGRVSHAPAKFGKVGERANEGPRQLGDLLGTTIDKRRLHQDAGFGVLGAGGLHGAREIIVVSDFWNFSFDRDSPCGSFSCREL